MESYRIAEEYAYRTKKKGAKIKSTWKLKPPYANRALPIVENQLAKAGLRLAHLLTGISILSFTFTRKPMPLTLSCQSQIARASLRWQCGTFWLFFGVAVRVSPAQPASPLTLVRPDHFRAPKITLSPGSLAVWQRQCRDRSQHAAEQPPAQVPFGRQKPVISRMFHQPSARFHQPLLQTRQRPVVDPLR